MKLYQFCFRFLGFGPEGKSYHSTPANQNIANQPPEADCFWRMTGEAVIGREVLCSPGVVGAAGP